MYYRPIGDLAVVDEGLEDEPLSIDQLECIARCYGFPTGLVTRDAEYAILRVADPVTAASAELYVLRSGGKVHYAKTFLETTPTD